MIQNKIKLILLIWPIVLLIGIWGNSSYQRYQIDQKLLDADGLVWLAGEDQFDVRVNEHESGELIEIRIEIMNPEKKHIHKTTEVIDRDMFGGGFVRAVQIDQDSENEILVWHSQAKYYLDFTQGRVREISFDQVPQQIKDLAKNWHKHNVLAGLEMTILLVFMICYYGLYVLGIGVLRLLKRKKTDSI